MVPELLDGTNHIPWFKAGEQIFEKRGIQYLGVNGFINAHSILATLIVQARSFMPEALVRRHLGSRMLSATCGCMAHRPIAQYERCHNNQHALMHSLFSSALCLLQFLSGRKVH